MSATGATRDDVGYKAETVGERTTGAHDETKWAPLTTEFWAMAVLIVAILIAAAVSDTLDDVRAWTLVTVIGAAYIISRGIAKAGSQRSFERERTGPSADFWRDRTEDDYPKDPYGKEVADQAVPIAGRTDEPNPEYDDIFEEDEQ